MFNIIELYSLYLYQRLLCQTFQLSIGRPVTLDVNAPIEGKGIQSIDVGFRLIDALLEADGPMPLKDLSAAADMSPSKAHNYIVSFRRVRMMAQDSETGHYMLGPAALELGLVYLARRGGLNVAERAILLIRERGKLSSGLFVSIWSEKGPVIVVRDEGVSGVPYDLRVGHHSSPLYTATGRTFLAYLPRSVTAPVVAAAEGDTVSPWGGRARVLSEKELEAELAKIRRDGIAVVNDLRIPGMTGITAPVLDHRGGLDAVITMIGVSGSFDTRADGIVATELRDAIAKARQG
ncbi:MAG: helix-turn-helix domain-containing protein [Alphaproteobacteria bacterium]|nr:helix-turn-helix domain-containing protein [Alphaproteobacteria bacterium]